MVDENVSSWKRREAPRGTVGLGSRPKEIEAVEKGTMTVDEAVRLISNYSESNGMWLRDAARFLLPYVRPELTTECQKELEQKLTELIHAQDKDRKKSKEIQPETS